MCFTTIAKHYIFGFISLFARVKGTSLREEFQCLGGEERETSTCRRGITQGEVCAVILTPPEPKLSHEVVLV